MERSSCRCRRLRPGCVRDGSVRDAARSVGTKEGEVRWNVGREACRASGSRSGPGPFDEVVGSTLPSWLSPVGPGPLQFVSGRGRGIDAVSETVVALEATKHSSSDGREPVSTAFRFDAPVSGSCPVQRSPSQVSVGTCRAVPSTRVDAALAVAMDSFPRTRCDVERQRGAGKHKFNLLLTAVTDTRRTCQLVRKR